jgi:hypothetical protein
LRWVRFTVRTFTPVGMKEGDAGRTCCSAHQGSAQDGCPWKAKVLVSPVRTMVSPWSTSSGGKNTGDGRPWLARARRNGFQWPRPNSLSAKARKRLHMEP